MTIYVRDEYPSEYWGRRLVTRSANSESKKSENSKSKGFGGYLGTAAGILVGLVVVILVVVMVLRRPARGDEPNEVLSEASDEDENTMSAAGRKGCLIEMTDENHGWGKDDLSGSDSLRRRIDEE